MLDIIRLLLDKMKDTQACEHAARVGWDLNPRADLVDVQYQRYGVCILMGMIQGTYCLDFMRLLQDGDL